MNNVPTPADDIEAMAREFEEIADELRHLRLLRRARQDIAAGRRHLRLVDPS